MVHSPSWAANWFAASQEIPRISRNSKVHYRTHKRPPPVSILGQPNPVPIPTYHLLEIHPNIIHPSTPRSPQWSLSLRFPHQDPIHSPLLTHTRQLYQNIPLRNRMGARGVGSSGSEYGGSGNEISGSIKFRFILTSWGIVHVWDYWVCRQVSQAVANSRTPAVRCYHVAEFTVCPPR